MKISETRLSFRLKKDGQDNHFPHFFPQLKHAEALAALALQDVVINQEHIASPEDLERNPFAQQISSFSSVFSWESGR